MSNENLNTRKGVIPFREAREKHFLRVLSRKLEHNAPVEVTVYTGAVCTGLVTNVNWDKEQVTVEGKQIWVASIESINDV